MKHVFSILLMLVCSASVISLAQPVEPGNEREQDKARPDARVERTTQPEEQPSNQEFPFKLNLDQPESIDSDEPSKGDGIIDEAASQPDQSEETEAGLDTQTLTQSTQKRLAYTKRSFKRWFEYSGWRIAVIIAIALASLIATNHFAKYLLTLFTRDKQGTEISKRAQTLSSIIRYVLIVTILVIAGMMILKEMELDIGPILAGAGVAGLAVGFGAQSLIKDIISGFFILLDDQIRVGDVVKLADKSGYVQKVSLRMVVLRDISGNVHYIPTGEISIVTNRTKEFSRYLFEVSVAYKEDVDQVIEVMKEIDEGLRNDPKFADFILAPLDVLGLDRFDSSGVVIKARTKTVPIKQWRVGREFKKRLKKRFDELGIEIPFPHLTLYPGVAKSGESPPFYVAYKAQPDSLQKA